MSFIEKLLISSQKISVPCQTDEEYKITSNQCSWCAALFGLKYKELKDAFISDKSKFLEIYTECLKEGTNLRKEFGKPVYGENIDNETLKEKLNLEDKIMIEFTYELNKDSRDELVSILPEDLKKEFYTEKYIDISDFLALSLYKFILISRHGQSFTLVPFGEYFLVLDSHVHNVGLMTKDNAYKYIKYSLDYELTGYLFTTILCCT